MNVKDLIEILRELPKGSMVVLQRNEFEAMFRDSDPRRRADNIARLNGCDLTLDEKSEVARFTKVECPAPWRRENGVVRPWPLIYAPHAG